MTDCALCLFQRDCSSRPLALAAENPLLGEILTGILASENLPYRQFGEVILLSQVEDGHFADVARRRLTDRETRDIRITRSSGNAMINAVSLSEWLHHTDSSWFDHALENDSFETWFQPIYDVQRGQVFAHECLIRLNAGRLYNGGEIISAAVARGHIHVFDSYSRRLAIRCAGRQDRSRTKLFINFMPSSIYDPEFCMRSTHAEMDRFGIRAEEVIFEVVESDAITDIKHLRKICDYYRNHGFGFALDDVGTGSNSLQMMCDIRPDFVKIDKSLIGQVASPMYSATIKKIVELADEFGLSIIAEGIEDENTRDLVAGLGATLMQGYYFGRPAPAISESTDLSRLAGAISHNKSAPGCYAGREQLVSIRQ